MERERKKLLLVGAITIVIVVGSFIGSSLTGTTNVIQAAKFLGLQTDTMVVHTPYWYRTLSADYDSVTALCTFGEMFVVHANGDSTIIGFNNLSPQEDYTTTLDSLNYFQTSEPMLLSNTDNISMFRSMGYQHMSDIQQDLGLPDTITWVSHVVKVDGDVWLGTIDSVCMMKKDTGMFLFPEFSGTTGTASWDVLSIPAQTIPGATTGDSVYIRLTMTLSGDAVHYFYSDHWRLNAKFSEHMNLGKKSGGTPSALITSFSVIAYPNPAVDHIMVDIDAVEPSSGVLSLVTIDGRNVATIRTSTLEKGTNRILYSLPSNMAAGAYYLLLMNNDGAVLGKHKLLVTK